MLDLGPPLKPAAKALVALLDALATPSGDGQVIKLAERRAGYGSAAGRCA